MPTLTFLGHDAFLLEDEQVRLIFDPFLKGNPAATLKPEQVKVDYVLLTHGHGDHFGDGLQIAKANDATIIAPYELATACGKRGAKTHGMHIGGAFHFPFGRVKLTIAHHGSGADLGGDTLAYMGNPCGFLVTLGEKTVYHAGDTGLFLDMQLIGEMNPITVALLPIGDNFTMGVDDAVKACEFIKPQWTVPMHYNTFDVIAADPHSFKTKAEAIGHRVKVMSVGEAFTF